MKKLLDYGFPFGNSDYRWIDDVLEETTSVNRYKSIPAYTNEEFFDHAPTHVHYLGNRYGIETEKVPGFGWKAYFEDGTQILNYHTEYAITEVDARAKIMIYLYEQYILLR